MIPSNALALVVFLVAVAPGYVYQLVVERGLTRRTRSALVEAIDLLCIGAFCTVVASLVTLALGLAVPGLLLRLEELATAGAASLTWRALASAVLALALSVGLAVLVGRVRLRTAPRVARVRSASVWTNTFTKYRQPGIGLTVELLLRDGRSIAGRLDFADTADDPDKRDLTLKAPLYVAEAGDTEHRRQPHQFVIVPGKDIAQIWGHAPDVARANAPTLPKENHGPDPIVDSGRAPGGPRQ